jgi:hypothetical protein
MPRFSIGKTLPTLICLAAGVAAHAAEPRVLVTMSKETTYITEPLRPDGYPDYVAFLNRQMSHGVRPENNAAVPFWKAVGPEEIHPADRERYFQMLGMSPLPEKGDYFVTSGSHIVLNEDTGSTAATKSPSDVLRDQLQAAMKRPWSKREFPVWAAWLENNEKPLALLVEASKRPRRYDPLVVSGTVPLAAVLQPATFLYRYVPDALVARAMLQLGEGHVDEAWDDILAAHRLARLAGQGPTMVDAITARSISEQVSFGSYAILRHPNLTAAQIARMRADCDRLPPMPRIIDRINTCERFVFLDAVLRTARDVRASPTSIARSMLMLEKTLGLTPQDRAAWKLIAASSGDPTINWDAVLRMSNARYDKWAAAMRMPAGGERRKAVKSLQEDTAFKTNDETAVADQPLPGEMREARSRRLQSAFMAMFFTGVATSLALDDRTTMRSELTDLAFGLAAYRADHGAYPARLADLAPKYIRAVPRDIFNDAELHYRPEKDGYLLYSVGDNGKDDGGRSYDDRKKDMTYEEMTKRGEAYDDLSVRISAPSH